ncbi:uncharacterized protein UV8b_06462 [Ustilaginoidea virens]|uniref:Probable aspartic-type endopeptidase OPSB n=1 Tax=Ustilaginoidea virens TaxID=1159556 RepID=A0A063C4P5_USTVR|nr:uncharacterized protein UV8b_06462 [Ustilaginoidea virens]QUC22221.1 hypothetical protein UV8b_06462 [Ustilaginoidea virens]GAO14063.1 hypothetical protein UVI_02038440 [Ustilaginoidea virens]
MGEQQTLYFLNATLGTPPQKLSFHIDTGSSDLWVNTPSSRLCSFPQKPCSDTATYSANKSSTYHYVGSYFNISYVDGSGAAGDYATDTLRFSGQNISSLQFGIGYRSTAQQNVLGLGYPANEAQVTDLGMQPYQNLLPRMRAQGVVSSDAFSLWLNDLGAATGSILFGGVDTEKYHGNLISLPIQKVGDAYSQFYITLTGLDAGPKTVAADMALAVLLDSGSSLTYLPNDLVSRIYERVGAAYQEADGVAFVPCSLRNRNDSMTFKFSSPASITLSLSSMVLDLDESLTGANTNTTVNNEEACLFGIAPAAGSNSVLGDTFLRGAYVVYDMSNNQIALANAKFNVTATNVVEIGGSNGNGNGSAVPVATKASNPVTATSGFPSLERTSNDSGAAGISPSSPMALAGVVAGAAITVAIMLY